MQHLDFHIWDPTVVRVHKKINNQQSGFQLCTYESKNLHANYFFLIFLLATNHMEEFCHGKKEEEEGTLK